MGTLETLTHAGKSRKLLFCETRFILSLEKIIRGNANDPVF